MISFLAVHHQKANHHCPLYLTMLNWDKEEVKPHEDNFHWVEIGIRRIYIEDDVYFFWKAWEQLLHQLKLEYESSGKGFWCNRRAILCNAKYLTIVVPKAHPNYVIGFYIAEKSKKSQHMKITFFQSFVERRGYGSMMANHILKSGESVVADDILPESLGFWEKMGIQTT